MTGAPAPRPRAEDARNVIGTLAFEVHVPDATGPLDTPEALTRALRRELVPAIDAVLTEAAARGLTGGFERIEVDLGVLSDPTDYDTARRRLRDALRAALSRKPVRGRTETVAAGQRKAAPALDGGDRRAAAPGRREAADRVAEGRDLLLALAALPDPVTIGDDRPNGADGPRPAVPEDRAVTLNAASPAGPDASPAATPVPADAVAPPDALAALRSLSRADAALVAAALAALPAATLAVILRTAIGASGRDPGAPIAALIRDLSAGPGAVGGLAALLADHLDDRPLDATKARARARSDADRSSGGDTSVDAFALAAFALVAGSRRNRDAAAIQLARAWRALPRRAGRGTIADALAASAVDPGAFSAASRALPQAGPGAALARQALSTAAVGRVPGRAESAPSARDGATGAQTVARRDSHGAAGGVPSGSPAEDQRPVAGAPEHFGGDLMRDPGARAATGAPARSQANAKPAADPDRPAGSGTTARSDRHGREAVPVTDGPDRSSSPDSAQDGLEREDRPITRPAHGDPGEQSTGADRPGQEAMAAAPGASGAHFPATDPAAAPSSTGAERPEAPGPGKGHRPSAGQDFVPTTDPFAATDGQMTDPARAEGKDAAARVRPAASGDESDGAPTEDRAASSIGPQDAPDPHDARAGDGRPSQGGPDRDGRPREDAPVGQDGARPTSTRSGADAALAGRGAEPETERPAGHAGEADDRAEASGPADRPGLVGTPADGAEAAGSMHGAGGIPAAAPSEASTAAPTAAAAAWPHDAGADGTGANRPRGAPVADPVADGTARQSTRAALRAALRTLASDAPEAIATALSTLPTEALMTTLRGALGAATTAPGTPLGDVIARIAAGPAPEAGLRALLADVAAERPLDAAGALEASEGAPETTEPGTPVWGARADDLTDLPGAPADSVSAPVTGAASQALAALAAVAAAFPVPPGATTAFAAWRGSAAAQLAGRSAAGGADLARVLRALHDDLAATRPDDDLRRRLRTALARLRIARPAGHPAEREARMLAEAALRLAFPWIDDTAEASLAAGMASTIGGVVLFHRYLPQLFARAGCLAPDRTIADPARARALIEALADPGRAATADRPADPILPVLLGLPPFERLPDASALTDADLALLDGLTRAVIDAWGALGATSPAGLREAFVQREAFVRPRPDGASDLHVTEGPFDMLLDRLPFSIRLIRLAWMPAPLHVKWRDRDDG